MSKAKKDHGQHYRFSYNGINLDPFRICQIYNVSDFALQTIVKKALCAGGRGHKDFRQDLLDIICAAERRLEMLDEDNVQSPLPYAMPEGIIPLATDHLPWIKNTGTKPDCGLVLIKHLDGLQIYQYPKDIDWSLDLINPIIEYQICYKKPQSLPWIKNTGDAPDCKKVLAKRKDDEYCKENNVESLSWGLLNDNYDIVEYLILE